MEPVTHLRAAADILRRDGWTRYALRDERGAKCALGSLGMRDVYLSSRRQHLATLRALATVLGCALPSEPDLEDAARHYAARITGWNDHPEQSLENVILALEFAAIVEEQRRALAQPSATRTEAV